jgi:hypothetical protein
MDFLPVFYLRLQVDSSFLLGQLGSIVLLFFFNLKRSKPHVSQISSNIYRIQNKTLFNPLQSTVINIIHRTKH